MGICKRTIAPIPSPHYTIVQRLYAQSIPTCQSADTINSTGCVRIPPILRILYYTTTPHHRRINMSKEQRHILSHVKTHEQINDHKIVIIAILWSGDNPPTTRAYKRTQQGWGVICLCPAHEYNRDCYHKKLVREYINDNNITSE